MRGDTLCIVNAKSCPLLSSAITRGNALWARYRDPVVEVEGLQVRAADFFMAGPPCQGDASSVRHNSRLQFRLLRSRTSSFSPPLAHVLIDQLPVSTIIHNGSSSQQRKGYLSLGCPLLSQPSCVAQDHPRAGCRADLQACEEGCHSLAVRISAAGRRNGVLTRLQDW
jgi:hypothetical protein